MTCASYWVFQIRKMSNGPVLPNGLFLQRLWLSDAQIVLPDTRSGVARMLRGVPA